MKVVFDTNVLASIAIAQMDSTLGKIYKAWSLDIFEVITSEFIRIELKKTLYQSVYFSSRLHQNEIERYMNQIENHSFLQKKIATINRNLFLTNDIKLPNVEDDNILAAAIDAHASYVITGDKAILSLKQIQNIDIINPVNFLEILSTQLFFYYNRK